MSKLSTVEECIFDVSFEANAVVESFFGPISLVDGFDEILKLSLHQIPEAIRKSDPNLKYQPMYEIRSKENPEYKILLGDNSIGISLNNAGKYTSWSKSFFPEVQELFTTIIKSGKIKTINRIGLRYIDFIENDNIFQDGKINININGNDTQDKKMFLRVESEISGVSYVKNITNNTQYKAYKNAGSIIDIVTFIDNKNLVVTGEFDMDTFFKEIDTLHTVHTDKFKEVIRDKDIERYGI